MVTSKRKLMIPSLSIFGKSIQPKKFVKYLGGPNILKSKPKGQSKPCGFANERLETDEVPDGV